MPDSTDSTAVIGAGAAGLVAAIFAARAGGAVEVIEKTRRGGKKIVVSGGGRCNVLPSAVDASRFITDSSPRTLARILRSWPLAEQRRFFEDDLGLPLALEPETGKLFPQSNRATDVRDALVDAARRAGARFRFDTAVESIEPREGGRWTLGLSDGDRLVAGAVVVATGGLSVPKTGSDGFGLHLARRLGHRMHPTYPALTPLTATPAAHASLSGISLTARLRAPLKKGEFETEGGFLFTHRGYSGPSVLDLSHLTTLARTSGRAQPVLAQWDEWDEAGWDEAFRAPGAGTVGALVRQRLPTRLADQLLDEAGVSPDTPRAELPKADRRRLVEVLAAYPLPWTGDEGYKKAEVTGGGVALGEVDPKTMESRRQAGLFFCGEVLDAFGPIGGYNFLWAWATGRLAGLGAATASRPEARD
jgi:predicted Rossmann fold flavoprotein